MADKNTSPTRVFQLTYTQGSRKYDVNFEYEGNPNSAREYARDFCERMGYRFHFCAPFIVRLEDLEMQKAYAMRDAIDTR